MVFLSPLYRSQHVFRITDGERGVSVPQLKVLAALQSELLLGLAGSALETKDDLLGGLGLLVEHGLGLSSVSALLTVVTALTLGEKGSLDVSIVSVFARFARWGFGGVHLSSLVLGNLVLLVLVALLGLAVRPAGFGNVDLVRGRRCQLVAEMKCWGSRYLKRFAWSELSENC